LKEGVVPVNGNGIVHFLQTNFNVYSSPLSNVVLPFTSYCAIAWQQLKMAENGSEVETQKSTNPYVFAVKRLPQLRSKVSNPCISG